mmetsp:Transcript_70374/g.131649  ORF Transcript_70374/g.131649 Transcript_70374/m.131649 type:complete len:87 (+) Transcript_70374:82-342(+)
MYWCRSPTWPTLFGSSIIGNISARACCFGNLGLAASLAVTRASSVCSTTQSSFCKVGHRLPVVMLMSLDHLQYVLVQVTDLAHALW